jgi:hypothetical protein
MFSAYCSAVASERNKAIIEFVDGSHLTISALENKVFSKYTDKDNSKKIVSIDANLSKLILSSESLKFIMHNSIDGTAIMISSHPSTKSGGSGFCGAGHEDYAILIEKKNNAVILKDSYLLQSCLKSITLDSDDPEDILSGLSIDSTAFTVTFTILEDPKKKKNILSVIEGKFSKN